MRLGLIVSAFTALALATGPARADDITLGVSTPLTGGAAIFGKSVVDGARAAIDQINSHGGVSGKRLGLAVSDDHCDPGSAAQVTERMITVDKVAALIGYPCGATSLAAAQRAQVNKILLIATSGAPSATSGPAGPVLRMLDSQDRLADTVADYIKNTFHNKKVGIWLPGSGAFATKVQQSIESRGVKLSVVDIITDASAPGWVPTVDVVVTTPFLTSFLSAARQSNPNLTALVPASVLSEPLIQVVRGSAGVVALTNPSAQYFPDAADALARAKQSNLDTTGYFVYAYAAVEVFAESARRAPSLSGDDLFKAAIQSPIKTVLGNRKFDERGIIQGLYIIGTIKAGDTIASVDLSNDRIVTTFRNVPRIVPSKRRQ